MLNHSAIDIDWPLNSAAGLILKRCLFFIPNSNLNNNKCILYAINVFKQIGSRHFESHLKNTVLNH